MKREHVSEHLVIAANQNRKERDYWLDHLAEPPRKAMFYYDDPEKIEVRKSGEQKGDRLEIGEYGFQLSGEAFAAAMKLSNRSDARLHMILTAAAVALLHKYGCGDDIIIGTPIYRQQVESQFINTMLPLRFNLGVGMTYKDLLLQTRQVIKEAVEHQNYPLEILSQQLGLTGVANESPLFDVAVLLENIQPKSYLGDLLPALAFLFQREENSITCRIRYRELLYREETVKRIGAYFQRLFQSLSSDVNLLIADAELMDGEERRNLYQRCAGKQLDYPSEFPRDLPVYKLFEARVAESPDRVAVHADVTLTYAELNFRANELALLLHERGVDRDTVVAVLTPRSAGMLIALLGIMKAGGAYLPLDTSLPAERIVYMLRDSDAQWLLAGKDTASIIDIIKERGVRSEIVLLDSLIKSSGGSGGKGQFPDPECINGGQDLAYVIYTSGSTGRPKGVMVEHRNLTAYVHSFLDEFKISETSLVVQQATYAFDTFAEEVYPALVKGAGLIIPDRQEVRDINRFARILSKHCVTFVDCSPLMLDRLNQPALISHLKSVELFISGGDVLRAEHISRLADIGQVYNTYGPTETTVCASYYKCTGADEDDVPIGFPIANYQVSILDRQLNLLPPGAPGELCIGGHGVARGYLNNPELTAERFSVIPGNRIYKSGDMARWLPDGGIQFLGRLDSQVKIRGFRIELGEIEAKLSEHPEIREAVVVIRGERRDDLFLCAYVASDHVFEPSELREYLGKILPEYMVPWFFVTLKEMPLTSSGKIDRRALPEPETHDARPYVPPSGEVEKKLVDIWAAVLKVEKEKIGVDNEFFQLGGNSLMATVLTAKIHKAFDIPLKLTDIFKLQSIRAIGRVLKGGGEDSGFEAIPSAPEQDFYPLSSAQKRLYFLQRMDPESKVYNMPNMVHLDVDLEIRQVNRAFHQLVQRHESLRTAFQLVDGEPVQRILGELEAGAEYFTTQSETETGESISGFIRPFDLGCAPLVRIGIIRILDGGYIFMADLHHIISDGVSQNILVRDFISLYQGKVLPALRIHYKDYALWLLNQDYGSQGKYWLNEFTVSAPVMELPTDFSRPMVRSFQGRSMHFRLDSDLTMLLKQLVADSGATLYMVLLAGLNILLSKYSGMEDIVIGAVTAGRRHADLDKVIGMFVNTLALRNFPSPDLSYMDFLEQVKERSLKAYENQDYPFETLIEALSLNRDTSRNPLFDVMLVLDTYDSRSSMEGETVTRDWGHRVSKFDLTFMCVDHGEELLFMVEFCTALFTEETIKRIFNHYRRVLETTAAQRDILLGDIPLADEEERRHLLEMANGPVSELSHHLTLHRLFEEQVQRTPDHTALFSAVNRSYRTNRTYKDEKSYLSYGELNRRAEITATALREQGIGPGQIAAIKMDPCVELIIAIFGILKAGAVYLPIDPEYPLDRIDYMLSDSNAALVLDAPLEIELKERVLNPGHGRTQREAEPLQSQEAAYIIYTSGTTGHPKGVLVGHKGVVNTLACRKGSYGFDETWIMLQLFSFAFDGFVTGMFTPLISGSRVILPAAEEARDIKNLSSMIALHAVNHFISVPPLYREIITRLAPDRLRSLRKVTLAGDVVSPDLPEISRQKHPELAFYLEYGVTEASVMSTIHRHRHGEAIQIGKPVSNTEIHILDKKGRPQPVGVAGELCIGGSGVAMGYLNRQELTVEKFRDGKYYSGDLACWTVDGNIRFLGRVDHQVKIRGFRIETGEIENRLLTHEAVDAAVVLARQDGNGQRFLAAFLVLNSQKEIPVSQFRSYLAGTLPQYMIPSYFMVLESLPLTANGKIDRRALTSVNIENLENLAWHQNSQNRENYVEPVTGMEKQVAVIWGEVLTTEKIGLHDNFFDLGGNSFDIMKISDRLEKELNKDIPVVKLFKYPTVSTLAHYLNHGEAGEISSEELQKISENKARGKNRLKERSRRKRTK